MSQEKKKSIRSYHGNHANYIESKYEDGYGNEQYKSVCYFNPFFDKAALGTAGYSDSRDFKYLFKKLAKDSGSLLDQRHETIGHLKKLAALMLDQKADEDADKNNSTIPPGYTYWGQFLDHDITAGTDSSHEFRITQNDFTPIDPDQVERDIENIRTPFFDLDSAYGDKDGPFGPMFRLYDPNDLVKFKIAINANNGGIPGSIPNPELGLARDLPRNNDGLLPGDPLTIALIGDRRNDENTIVSQFHLSWLRFHNRVIDELRSSHPDMGLKALFAAARKEVTQHYHWLIVHDFLKRMLDSKVYEEILKEYNNPKQTTIFEDFNYDTLFMPLEFSTAAYRFGHSMVRNAYDFNQNFGTGDLAGTQPGEVIPEAGFGLLFAFTGTGGERLKGSGQPTIQTTLPFNWIIEWERFFDTDLENGTPKRFARKIDTRLAIPLQQMVNNDFNLLSEEEQMKVVASGVSEARFNQIMQHLAERNLLRGYLLSIPTGQAIANYLKENKVDNISVLSADQLQAGNSPELNHHLKSSGLLKKTPLWFYLLKESEVLNNGNSLGPLGSYLIGRTFIGLLKKGYAQPGWNPATGIVATVSKQPFSGIMDMLRFAGVAVEKAPAAEAPVAMAK